MTAKPVEANNAKVQVAVLFTLEIQVDLPQSKQQLHHWKMRSLENPLQETSPKQLYSHPIDHANAP